MTQVAPGRATAWLVLAMIAAASFGNFYVYDSMGPVADLLQQQLYRASLVRIDGCEGDADALAGVLSEALGAPLQGSSRALRHPFLPAGHWRRYAEVLAGPFAQLTPVAMRLGYPET